MAAMRSGFDNTVQNKIKIKVYKGHGAPARQTTCPDLLRLTR
jgi:hypothetical protein